MGDGESASLDIMQPALFAHVAAFTTALLASSHRSAYRPRSVFYVKPCDQFWWKWFADGCYFDEEWRRHFRITRQSALQQCQCL